MSFRLRVTLHNILVGLGLGTFLAVQGVFMGEHGAEVWQIGLIIGLFGAIVAVAEVPLGVLADTRGRIAFFRVALVLQALAGAILVVFPNLWGLLAGASVLALSTASSSGTIDAWAVERVKAEGHEERLQQYLGGFQAAMAAGITGGAILGGYLPALTAELPRHAPTTWNALFMSLVAAVHLFLTPYFFHEGETLEEVSEEDNRPAARMRAAIGFAARTFAVRDILILGAVLGVGMAMVEGYWQPRLVEIDNSVAYFRFGWITAGYFAMAILGPLLIGVFAQITGVSARAQLLALPILIAAALWLLSLQTGFWTFVAAYLGLMLVITMAGPAESTVMNKATPDRYRSSVHSLSSLMMRGGAAVAVLALAPVVKTYGVDTGWKIAAGILGVYSVLRLAFAVLRPPSPPRAPETGQ
jgi:DHA1 family quinolone resistance protein-like MFS transporter